MSVQPKIVGLTRSGLSRLISPSQTLLLLPLFLLIACTSVSRQSASGPYHRHALELSPGYNPQNATHLFTTIEVDGELLRAVVDTGASVTLFRNDYFRDRGYHLVADKNTKIRFPFFNASPDVYEVKVDSISIGPVQLDKNRLKCTEYPPEVERSHPNIQCILGTDILEAYDGILSLQDLTLYLRSHGRHQDTDSGLSASDILPAHANHHPIELRYSGENGPELIIDTVINDIEAMAILDTGALLTIIDRDRLGEMGLRSEALYDQGAQQSGAETFFLKVDTLRIGAVDIGDVTISSKSYPKTLKQLQDDAAVYVGMDVLLRAGAVISFGERRLYLRRH